MYGMNFNDGARQHHRCTANIRGRTACSPRTCRGSVSTTASPPSISDVDGAGLRQRQRRLPGRHLLPRHPQRHHQPARPGPDQPADNTATGAREALRQRHGSQFRRAEQPRHRVNCTYIFTADGRLTPQTGARFGAGPTGGFTGGNGQTGREGQTVSVLPFLERYNVNLLVPLRPSRRRSSSSPRPSGARVNALGNNAGPSFIQGQNDPVRLPRACRGWTTRS